MFHNFIKTIYRIMGEVMKSIEIKLTESIIP
jgi:hypothetical protein